MSRPVYQRFAAMRAGGGCGRLVGDFFIPRLIIRRLRRRGLQDLIDSFECSREVE
jgi:hypothetical protein